MGHDEQTQMLEEASGPEFELRFMAMMSVHHAQAIERAKAVRRHRLHGKVRRLTRGIVRAQEREIGQLEEWLVAWDVPILMLTAKAAEEQRVRGFDVGADDYLVKPFSPRKPARRLRSGPAPRHREPSRGGRCRGLPAQGRWTASARASSPTWPRSTDCE